MNPDYCPYVKCNCQPKKESSSPLPSVSDGVWVVLRISSSGVWSFDSEEKANSFAERQAKSNPCDEYIVLKKVGSWRMENVSYKKF